MKNSKKPMDKKRALIILIKNSYFLPLKTKENLLKKIVKMPGKQVDTLGSLLAYEQEFVQKNKEQIIKNVNDLIS